MVFSGIGLLFPVRKRVFFAISSSDCRFACATYGKYDSAQTLVFLELIEKYLVSSSGTTQSPSRLFGQELADVFDIKLKHLIVKVFRIVTELTEASANFADDLFGNDRENQRGGFGKGAGTQSHSGFAHPEDLGHLGESGDAQLLEENLESITALAINDDQKHLHAQPLSSSRSPIFRKMYIAGHQRVNADWSRLAPTKAVKIYQ